MRLILICVAMLLMSACSAQFSNGLKGVTAFAKTPNAFQMPIEAAGLASLPEVRLDPTTGELFIAYRYTAGTAQRAGEMTLQPAIDDSAHYTGNWRTVEDNGTVYAGELYFDFAADGTATGVYTFGGGQYAIAIERKVKPD